MAFYGCLTRLWLNAFYFIFKLILADEGGGNLGISGKISESKIFEIFDSEGTIIYLLIFGEEAAVKYLRALGLALISSNIFRRCFIVVASYLKSHLGLIHLNFKLQIRNHKLYNEFSIR